MFETIAEAMAAAGRRVVLGPRRCKVTGNECGTDTWELDRPCVCPECQAYLRDPQQPRRIEPLRVGDWFTRAKE